MSEDRDLGFHRYYMDIARAVARRANCRGRSVGAVMVLDNRIVSTGYNGTPEGMQNCKDGGCYRCANRDRFDPGTGYDICICVHAEQNALLAAARFGIAVQSSVVYSTLQPCLGCMKEMLQVRVEQVFYDTQLAVDENVKHEYDKLLNRFPQGVKHLRAAPAIDAPPSAASANDDVIGATS